MDEFDQILRISNWNNTNLQRGTYVYACKSLHCGVQYELYLTCWDWSKPVLDANASLFISDVVETDVSFKVFTRSEILHDANVKECLAAAFGDYRCRFSKQ